MTVNEIQFGFICVKGTTDAVYFVDTENVSDRVPWQVFDFVMR